MTSAHLISRAFHGIRAPEVSVEVHITRGRHYFSIVGLPETAVKESRDRVRAALINSGFDFPMQRIIVNLAPADLPKEGGRFDLPIALGILMACGALTKNATEGYEFAGELSLAGELKPFKGSLLFAMATTAMQRRLIVPLSNAEEAAVVENSQVYGADTLLSVYQHLTQHAPLSRIARPIDQTKPLPKLDMVDVIGQVQAKRALLIAASGGHHILMIGPPGTGKTMLASRLGPLLPPLTETEAIELAAIRSLSGHEFQARTWRLRPFRAPHHTSSSIALVGGSSPPKPGEISLAHQGVLFLDELPEFPRSVLEALREPLESGTITISRAAQQAEFPARFQLIAAMNPCPCGYANTPGKTCHCSVEQIRRYQHRLSGPLLDRIDLHIHVKPVSAHLMLNARPPFTEASSDQLTQIVAHARNLQQQRQQKLNSALGSNDVMLHCWLDSAGHALLKTALDRWQLSGRTTHRVLRVARTIADLSGHQSIQTDDLAEALLYRPFLQT